MKLNVLKPIGAISLILLLGWPIEAHSQGNSSSIPIKKVDQSHNASQLSINPNSLGTERTPVIVRVLPAEKNKDEAEIETKDRAEKAALDQKLVDFNGDLAQYTFWLAIMALLQFIALCVQASFLRGAFKESKRAGDIARDAMIAGERAFVFAIGISAYWDFDKENKCYNWRFRPTWKNSGDTPTKNMTMHAGCMLLDKLPDAGFDFNYSTNQTGKALIPPNTTTQGGLAPSLASAAITPKDILDVQNGKKILMLYGWAKYYDVFPDTAIHETRFCFAITPLGDPLTFQPNSTDHNLTFPYIYHSEGNCADDECSQYKSTRIKQEVIRAFRNQNRAAGRV